MSGKWKMENGKGKVEKGEFVRAVTSFRNWVSKDGSPGPDGEGGYAAEPGYYYLYVSHACL